MALLIFCQLPPVGVSELHPQSVPVIRNTTGSAPGLFFTNSKRKVLLARSANSRFGLTMKGLSLSPLTLSALASIAITGTASSRRLQAW
jgi:hypothetical protein